MDYKKAYREAVEAVKKLKEANSSDEGIQNWVNDNFPNLQESEDEIIRKVLVSVFEEHPLIGYDVTNADVLAWLEKQGEQESVAKVAPKYKVGDWCIDNEDGTIFQIVKVLSNTYTYNTNEGKKYSCTHYSLEKDARLWNIQDSKDGDVLATPAGTFIYNGNNGGGNYPECYIGINSSGRFQIGGEIGNKVYPATKEQRDQLFAKLYKAGYEWDAEKKELKKISQEYPTTSDECIKPAWSEGDEKILDSILCDIGIADKTMGGSPTYESKRNWLESIKEKILQQPQLKQEWNEEDEKFFKTALLHIRYSVSNDHCETTDWLKSIKERMKGE